MLVPLNQLSRENGELFSKKEIKDGDSVILQDKRSGKSYRVTIRSKKAHQSQVGQSHDTRYIYTDRYAHCCH